MLLCPRCALLKRSYFRLRLCVSKQNRGNAVWSFFLKRRLRFLVPSFSLNYIFVELSGYTLKFYPFVKGNACDLLHLSTFYS